MGKQNTHNISLPEKQLPY